MRLVEQQRNTDSWKAADEFKLIGTIVSSAHNTFEAGTCIKTGRLIANLGLTHAVACVTWALQVSACPLRSLVPLSLGPAWRWLFRCPLRSLVPFRSLPLAAAMSSTKKQSKVG